MKNYHILFIFISVIIFSSCGFTYDVMAPKAEERRRNYVFNTYNYADFKTSTKGISDGKTYVTDLKSHLQTKHNASINPDGTLQGLKKHTENAENNFGPFQSYLEVDEVVSIGYSRKNSAMKGFKMKFPQTFTAKNHKPKTINIRKQIRIGPAIGNVFPLYFLGFFFEGGHLWKMKKSYDVVLEPTEAYKEYCEHLSSLAGMIKETKNCSESKKDVTIREAWAANVNYHVLLEKKFIKDFSVQKVSDWLPKKTTVEINQSHVNEVKNCIDKINNQESFFASSNSAKVYFEIIMATEKQELIAAKQKALEEAYDAFLKKEVSCDNGSEKLEQKDVWIFLAQTDNGSMVSTKNNYQWILNKDEKVNFEVKNIGKITTKSTFEKEFYARSNNFDYSGSHNLYCSKESASNKIKAVKSEQSTEIAKRKKAKKDTFESWLDEKVTCADNNKTIKKRYTWVIIKKNNKLYPYKIKNVKIDDYKLLQIYPKCDGGYVGEMLLKYGRSNWFSSESQTKKEIANRKVDYKRIKEEREELERLRKKEEEEERKKQWAREELEIKIVANGIQKCLSAFKAGYRPYPRNYTDNNCPYGHNCKMNNGTIGCLANLERNQYYNVAIDWLNDNGYDYLIDYWNDNNKSGQDIY